MLCPGMGDLEPIVPLLDDLTPLSLLNSRPCVRVYLCSMNSNPRIKRVLKCCVRGESTADEAAFFLFSEIYSHALITHPHVVKAFEYRSTKNAVGYTMEYLAGGDLRQCLVRNQRLSVSFAVKLLIQVIRGLEAVHRATLVHGDLKPENILLTRFSNAKIGDFGAAVNPVSSLLLTDKILHGTLDYMCPEQLLGEGYDERSDLYAVGLIAFELLTGHMLYGDQDTETRLRLRADEKSPLVFLGSSLPGARSFEQIIGKLLSRHPSERYQSCEEVLRDLAPIQSSLEDHPAVEAA